MVKRFSYIALTIGIVLIVIFISYQKNKGNLVKPSFLIDAANLARQTGGFYAKVGQVSVEKGMENNQHKLKLTLSDSGIKAHIVNIFFEDEDWKDVELVSGQYEVLFLKHALIINDPVTKEKHEYVVNNDALNEMKVQLPNNYFSQSARHVIGIAVYWNRDLATSQQI